MRGGKTGLNNCEMLCGTLLQNSGERELDAADAVLCAGRGTVGRRDGDRDERFDGTVDERHGGVVEVQHVAVE